MPRLRATWQPARRMTRAGPTASRGGAAAAGEFSALSESRVTFAVLADAAITRYLATGEADDKAGAYAIQGRAAGFLARLEGSYSGVMGLPLYELFETLKRRGVWPTGAKKFLS